MPCVPADQPHRAFDNQIHKSVLSTSITMSGNDQGDGSSSSDTDNDDKEALPDSIDSVWDHPRIKKITVDVPTPNRRTKQKVTWTCHMCNKLGVVTILRRRLLTGQETRSIACFNTSCLALGTQPKPRSSCLLTSTRGGGRGGSPRRAW